jgi:O-antigen ligase
LIVETRRWLLPLWLGVHAPLGIVMHAVPALATVHGLATVLLAIWVGLRRSAAEALWVAAYIAGCDVLWRASVATLPWELGKYGILLLFGLTLARRAEWFRLPVLPVLYFLALLPSALLTFWEPFMTRPVNALLFALLGPAALAVTAVFCVVIQFDEGDVIRGFTAMLAPLVGLTAMTVVASYLSGPIEFGGESNFETSGGFGPNQVSTVLGLGALLAMLMLLRGRWKASSRAILVVSAAVCSVQSVMTFSRGGMYGLVGALAFGIPFLARDRRSLYRMLVLVGFLGGAGYFVVLPQLDRYTGGALEARFSDTRTARREGIAEADIQVALQHPLWGVGPGASRYARERLGVDPAPAHTEWSRLLAEHGAFGLLAVLCLGGMFFSAVLSSAPGWPRAVAVSLGAWSSLTMYHNAMRVVAPSFVFGLMFAVAGMRLRRAVSRPDSERLHLTNSGALEG